MVFRSAQRLQAHRRGPRTPKSIALGTIVARVHVRWSAELAAVVRVGGPLRGTFSLAGRLCRGDLGGALFDTQNPVGVCPAEPLVVQALDEIRQRRLPGLLLVVRETTEFLRVHAELTSHLHVSMREVTPLSGFDPDLEVSGDLRFGHSCFGG